MSQLYVAEAQDMDTGGVVQMTEYVSAFTEDTRTPEQKAHYDILHPDWVDEVMRTTLLVEEPKTGKTFMLSPNNAKHILQYLVENGSIDVAQDILDFYMDCVDVPNAVTN